MMHVLKAQQFDREFIDLIFAQARILQNPMSFQKYGPLHHQLKMGPNAWARPNPILASLFYEASTRTRFSFEAAMLKLGGGVLSTENAEQFSSAAKGEILEDTIRVVSEYSDVIVLRHSEEGSAERASKVSSVPIINAGDGVGQHPTQALIDLYTIQQECGGIDGKTIALIGDLNYGRTIHSLAYMLTKYKVSHIYLVAPKFVQMKPELIQHFDKHNVSWSTSTRLKDVAADVDVFYQTRLQRERFRMTNFELYQEYQGVAHRYKIDTSVVELMKPDARILHPLPRLGEITMEVDADPRAAYFRQAQNGLWIRMALLLKVLNNI
jgi:aspartate carbamoyltransferase catalytic subunit